MPVEIEAKFRLVDPEAMRKKLAEAGAESLGTTTQCDTYYDTPDGTLLRSDQGFRIRIEQAANEKRQVLLTHKGPRRNGDIKIRSETEQIFASAESADAALESMGLEPCLSLQKRRESYRLGKATIALDELPQLGFFLEIEADSEAAVQQARKALGLADEPLVVATYAELVADHLGRREPRELCF